MNTHTEEKTDEAFEAELFDTFKFYGYLFPENPREVKVIESFLVSEKSDPPSLKNILLEGNNKEVFDEEYGLAAYAPDDNDPFSKLTEEEPDDQDNQE